MAEESSEAARLDRAWWLASPGCLLVATSCSVHGRAAGSCDTTTSARDYEDRRGRRRRRKARGERFLFSGRLSEVSCGRVSLLGDEVLRFGMGNDNRRCALLGLELELLGQADADATEVE